jgi:hypothetical protein
MSRAIALWSAPWGLFSDGGRVHDVRRAFLLAYPGENAAFFLDSWLRVRRDALAANLNYLSRWYVGRDSCMVRVRPTLRQWTGGGPLVVVFLHYSIDPVMQLSCLTSYPDVSFRWPMYPMQPGDEDDRALWLTSSELPRVLADVMLSIADSRWIVDAIGHLNTGGAVMMALDAPFDASRKASASVAVGAAALPIAPSIELFHRATDARLAFAWPQPESDSTWTLDFVLARDLEEISVLASHWIETHWSHWSGWPYLVSRESAILMRRNVVVREYPSMQMAR